MAARQVQKNFADKKEAKWVGNLENSVYSLSSMSGKVDGRQPAFWNQRYENNHTPWDYHGVPPALLSYLKSGRSSRVLVPGCGSGYEVQAFLAHGYDVIGLDFSHAAVARARRLLEEHERHRVLQADFFSHPFDHPFDLIYERAFLCALHPDRCKDYTLRMADLLPPGGKLVGVFFYGPESDPSLLSEAHARELFDHDFVLLNDQPVSDSIPFFQDGKECWQEWQRKT